MKKEDRGNNGQQPHESEEKIRKTSKTNENGGSFLPEPREKEKEAHFLFCFVGKIGC